jgi:hypothetical protein
MTVPKSERQLSEIESNEEDSFVIEDEKKDQDIFKIGDEEEKPLPPRGIVSNSYSLFE